MPTLPGTLAPPSVYAAPAAREGRSQGLLAWCIAACEYYMVLAATRVFGMAIAVRYLQNPNPLISVRLLRALGATVGEATTIKRGLVIDNAWQDEHSRGDLGHLVIGANCYIGEGVFFDLADRIELADDVVLSGQVAIVTHADCNRSTYLASKYPRQCAPVRIERGAWLGFRATVLAGTHVGEAAVVAAGSLARSAIEPRTVYGGLPAAKLRELEGD